MTRVAIKPELRVKCFCGEQVTVGHAAEDNRPVMFHPMPVCKRFAEDIPLDKFLRQLREYHMGIS